MFAAAALSLGSCATNSDIDELKDQLGDLENQIGQLERAQQEALLAQISRLEAEIAALQSELDGTQADLAAEYEALLADLTALQNEVASGEKVFYGSVLTGDDFSKLLESEATIITGDLVITSDDQMTQVANVELVGGNLVVKGGSVVSLPKLESVSGNVMIESMDVQEGSVNLPMLKAVGYDLIVANTKGLSSVDMASLLLVNGDLTVANNDGLMSLSFASLDMVAGDLDINAYWENDPNWESYGATSIVLSHTNVLGDAMFQYIGREAVINLGTVSGNLSVLNSGLKKLEMTGEKVSGTLTISHNPVLEEVSFPNLLEVTHHIFVEWNMMPGFIGPGEGLLKGLSCFDSLTTIGGDIRIAQNDFSELDAFNNVTSLNGENSEGWRPSIVLQQNGNTKSLINVFNALVETKQWNPVDIRIEEKTDWFNGFEKLTEAGVVNILLQRTMDAMWNQGAATKFEGFDAVTSIYGGTSFDLSDVTEFDAFDVVESISNYWGMTYFTLSVPYENSVKLCNLDTIITAIEDGTYDSSWNADQKAEFHNGMNWPSEIDIATLRADYLDTCN